MRYDVKTAIRNVQAGSLRKLLKSVNIPAPATRKITSSNKLKKLAATNLKSVFAVKRSTVRRKIKAKRKLQETLQKIKYSVQPKNCNEFIERNYVV